MTEVRRYHAIYNIGTERSVECEVTDEVEVIPALQFDAEHRIPACEDHNVQVRIPGVGTSSAIEGARTFEEGLTYLLCEWATFMHGDMRHGESLRELFGEVGE